MHKTKIVILFSLLTIVSTSEVKAETDVAGLIAKASAAREKVSQLGFEWTATAGLIESAKEANVAGNKELAIKLAQRALNQAKNGIKQSEYSNKHWQDNFPN